MPRSLLVLWSLSLLGVSVLAAELAPLAEEWDYAPAMYKVAARYSGKPGVVLHIGDSITYASPYSQWARFGRGKTPADVALCKWMHTGEKNDQDGWHLCSVDRVGNRSETAVQGIRADEFLAGGRAGIPPLAELIQKYNPQLVVLMLGTNDASANRQIADYQADMTRAVDLILANGSIPMLSTLPPHPQQGELVKKYNAALRDLARSKQLPLIDYWLEITRRRPGDWNGTLLVKDDVHPTARQGESSPVSEPTEENLKNSGYLLRGWLSVRKIAEVKARVLDKLPKREEKKEEKKPASSGTSTGAKR